MTVDLGMTVKEAAEALGMHVNQIYELCAVGKLPHRRVGAKGKQIRITEKHIERYLTACEVDQSNAPKSAEPPPRHARRRQRSGRLDPGRDLEGLPFKFIK